MRFAVSWVIACAPCKPYTAAHVASWTSADSILCIANRFWDLMPLRRDQKLFPHFGEAGTAVFAVEEVEYSGHDPTSLFELICTINSKLSIIFGPRCELDHGLALLSFLLHGSWSTSRRARPRPFLSTAPFEDLSEIFGAKTQIIGAQ